MSVFIFEINFRGISLNIFAHPNHFPRPGNPPGVLWRGVPWRVARAPWPGVPGASRRSLQKITKISTFRFCGSMVAPPGPQNGHQARPGEATIRPQKRKRTPQGATVIAAERARNFFLIFSRAKKRHFSLLRLYGGPKIPPERDSGRARFPIIGTVRGPFWSSIIQAQRWDSRFTKCYLPGLLRFRSFKNAKLVPGRSASQINHSNVSEYRPLFSKLKDECSEYR